MWNNGSCNKRRSSLIVTYPSSVTHTKSGFGLIASESLPAGTPVEKFEGTVSELGKIQDEHLPYVIRLEGDQWMIPQSNARFLNYSCEPNCRISESLDVLTSRAVAKGEELTIPHRSMSVEEYMESDRGSGGWNAAWSFRCQCGSPQCIGLIERYVVEMPQDPNCLKVQLTVSGERGRGVVAIRNIARDEIIERAPIIVIPEEQWDMIEPTTLRNYVFSWGPNDEHAAVALGYISMYNHSYAPNAKYVQSPDEVIIEIVALRDIHPGEEILVNYNGEPDDKEELWFPTV
jgi:uncharacterized protein